MVIFCDCILVRIISNGETTVTAQVLKTKYSSPIFNQNFQIYAKKGMFNFFAGIPLQSFKGRRIISHDFYRVPHMVVEDTLLTSKQTFSRSKFSTY